MNRFTARLAPIRSLLPLPLFLIGAASALAAPYTQRMSISTTYPTTFGDWENALVAGNGKLGIMVFGNPLGERVIFNDRGFNAAANASTPVRTFLQMSDADLEQIKSDCAAGNYAAANNLAVNAPQSKGGGEGNRHPGYEMLITIPQSGTVTNYSRTCDFRTGEINVKWTDSRGDWERKAFVSRKDNVVVQYLTAPSGGTLSCSIQLATESGMGFSSSWTFTKVSSVDFLDMRALYPSSSGGAGYEGVTRVIVNGGTKSVTNNVLNVSNASSVILLSRTEKYYTDAVGKWNQQLIQTQLAALPSDYETLLNGQKATHQAIYDRVRIDFGASAADRAKSNEELLAMQRNSSTPVKALWERIFDSGRYHYLSSSSNKTPPDLLGMWAGDASAGWGGWYHLDANLNLQIAQGNIGDMPEALEGYFAINEAWRPDFQTNARKLLGCRGMVACGNTPGNSGLKGPLSTFYPYQYATGEEPWLLYPFWEHYLVTGDEDFLRNRAYPMLKDMGEFYEDFLTKEDANGKYILAGSVSPEAQPAGLGVSLVNNSTFDLSGAKFAITALIQAANILGLEQGPGQGVEKWTAILNKLPPYLLNTDGALKEWTWPGLNDNYVHRHMSHLLTVWPYREIRRDTTPALADAALVVLSRKDAYHEPAGHGILIGALVGSCLNNADSVNKRLLQLTSEDYYYNSLATSHDNNHGTYCFDTANALPAVMMEMLVGSNPGEVELLPALPKTLTQGSIGGVKARSRVTVKALSWNTDAGTINCTLRSDISQALTLIQRKGIKTISTSVSTSSSPLGDIARVVQLQAGVDTDIALTVEPPPAPPAPPEQFGRWKFNETSGTTAADSSGNGVNGTLVGDTLPAWTTNGRLEGALAFNGTVNQAVTIPSANTLNPTDAITATAWINPNVWGTSLNRRILQKGSGDNQYRLCAETNLFKWDIRNVGAVSTSSLPPTGVWTHVAGTYDGSTMRLYFNGTQVGSLAASGLIPVTTDPLQIGTKLPASAAGNHFDGRIDDIRIYGRALSADEIASIATQTGTVTVTASDAAVQKGTASTARFLFARTGPTGSSLVVPFTLSTGAGFGVYQTDFSLSPAPPSITLPAGQSAVQLTLTPLDRAQPTGPLTVKVNVDEANGYDLDGGSSAEVQLLDSPINAWKIENFGSLAQAQAPLAADDADPDGDSETNLMEFGIGHLPLVANSGTSPDAEIEVIDGTPYLTCSFVRPRPAPTGITYVVETSRTLLKTDWANAISLPSYPLDLGNGTEQMKFRSIHPVDGEDKEFIRVRVSRP